MVRLACVRDEGVIGLSEPVVRTVHNGLVAAVTGSVHLGLPAGSAYRGASTSSARTLRLALGACPDLANRLRNSANRTNPPRSARCSVSVAESGYARRPAGSLDAVTMVGRDGEGPDFVRAFPAAMWPDVSAVTSIIDVARLASTAPFTVWVGEEQVSIPYRIYNPEPSVDSLRDLSPVQQTVLACLYTRHHDGHVRQRHLPTIVRQAELWVTPFVVRLLGEYVVQIILAIQCELVDVDVAGTPLRSVYGRFAASNRKLLDVTFQRAASYWDCYYRNLFADRRHYPSFPILASIRAAGREFQTAGCRNQRMPAR